MPNKLFVVTAETKRIRNREYFHYTNATVYIGFLFDKFIKFIEDGYIQFDLRLGVYRTGKTFGDTHDHGNGFRIQRARINELFKNSIIIK